MVAVVQFGLNFSVVLFIFISFHQHRVKELLARHRAIQASLTRWSRQEGVEWLWTNRYVFTGLFLLKKSRFASIFSKRCKASANWRTFCLFSTLHTIWSCSKTWWPSSARQLFPGISFQMGELRLYHGQTASHFNDTTALATGTLINKRLNEQNNRCVRAS